MNDTSKAGMSLSGIPASPGMAVGRVCFWSDPEATPRYKISPDMIGDELKRLDEALALSRKQLEQLQQRVEKEIGQDEAAIFSSHNLLLNDPTIYSRIEKQLISEGINLEAAVEDVIEELVKVFLKIPDPYIRERADDYRDIGRRLLDNLLSYQRQCTMAEGELIVLVARELMPSDTVHFHRHHVGAFVTERGGVSSHAAILARSLGLPAVVGISGVLKQLRAGELVVIDGTKGRIIKDPSESLITMAKQERKSRIALTKQERPAQITKTKDSHEIIISANLTREIEANEARRVGAMGVGLLRTEFLFMDHDEFLDEEGQYLAYRHVVEKIAPHTVTIRTLDLGEDKHFDFESPIEDNMSGCVLGWRSLRRSLADSKVFLHQLRAILRAAVHGPVRILLPMISGVEEIRVVRMLLANAAQELAEAGVPYNADILVGAMIETPAAAVVPRLILQEADFLSVGTNDLVQYTMVADRVSEKLQVYYRPTAPAILALLKALPEAGREVDKDVSICGEIAGDPLYLPLLLGLGFRNLSVAPVLIPDLAEAVTKLEMKACVELAQAALKKSTADEVEALLKANMVILKR